jgi:hypothetical protein
MDNDCAMRNAQLIIDNPNGNFTISSRGLEVISKFNIMGRLIKWIQDRRGGVTAKVNEIANETLKYMEKEGRMPVRMTTFTVKESPLSSGGNLEYSETNPVTEKSNNLIAAMERSNQFRHLVKIEGDEGIEMITYFHVQSSDHSDSGTIVFK